MKTILRMGALAALMMSASAYAVDTKLTATTFGDTVIANGSIPNVTAQPYGTTGDYYSTTGNGGITFTNLSDKATHFSFVHGSVDSYNTAEVLDKKGGILQAFGYNGNGDQGPNGTFTETVYFKPGTVGGFAMHSSQPAYEAANFVAGVPEPASWAMLVSGFALVGGMARRRVSTAVTA